MKVSLALAVFLLVGFCEVYGDPILGQTRYRCPVKDKFLRRDYSFRGFPGVGSWQECGEYIFFKFWANQYFSCFFQDCSAKDTTAVVTILAASSGRSHLSHPGFACFSQREQMNTRKTTPELLVERDSVSSSTGQCGFVLKKMEKWKPHVTFPSGVDT